MTAMLTQIDPAAGMTATEVGVLAALCVAAVGLVLLGRRLVKPVCVTSGAVLGLAASWVTVGLLPVLEPYWIPVLMAGALAGGLLAAAIFRLWVALASAALLALLVPAAVLGWQGTPLPIEAGGVEGDRGGAVEESAGSMPEVSSLTREDVESRVSEELEELGTAAEELRVAMIESLRGLAQRQQEAVAAWWEELGEPGRRNVVVGAAVGGLLGLLLGVTAPYTAASLLSSLSGGLLLVFAGRTLAIGLGGEAVSGYVPEQPRALAATVGLITVVGVIVQWTLRPKKDD